MKIVTDRGTRINRKVYFWILSFAKKYRLSLSLYVFFQIVNSVVHLSIFKFLQYFIDFVLPNKDVRMFYYLLAGVTLAVSLMFISTVLGHSINRNIQEKTSRDIQIKVFGHLRKLGLPYFESNSTGKLLSMLNSDVSAVQRIYREFIPILVRTGSILVLSFVALISINYLLVLIIVPVIVLYYIINPLLEKHAALLGRDVSNKRAESESKIYETISGISELRVYGSENWNRRRVIELRRIFNQAYLKELTLSYTRGSINISILFLGLVLLFISGSYLLQNNFVSIGELVASLFFYYQAVQSCTAFVDTYNEQLTVIYQAEKLYKLCNLSPKIKQDENPKGIDNVKGEIEFKNVSFKYDNKEVIKDFNLIIKSGSKTALVGESGNGKTTLLKLIGRLYDPYKGEVLLDGVPLTNLSLSQVRENIGYVFQETYLFGGTIAENIRFGNPDASNEQIVNAAKLAYIDEFIDSLPDKYSTIVGERGIKLSGGQKQRISIARLFLKDPQIILLDEATSSLDNISENEVKKAFDMLFEGRTVITVAHRISTIKDYDQIVMLSEGEIKESGTYEELITQHGEFYKLEHNRNNPDSEVGAV